MESERLIGAEHLPRSNTKQKRVTNLPGGACDSDFNRSFHDAISHKQLAEQSRSMRRQRVLRCKAGGPEIPNSNIQTSKKLQSLTSKELLAALGILKIEISLDVGAWNLMFLIMYPTKLSKI